MALGKSKTVSKAEFWQKKPLKQNNICFVITAEITLSLMIVVLYGLLRWKDIHFNNIFSF